MKHHEIDWNMALYVAEMIAGDMGGQNNEQRALTNLANAYLRLLNESAQLRFAVDAKTELA
jgi:hypothetical protein